MWVLFNPFREVFKKWKRDKHFDLELLFNCCAQRIVHSSRPQSHKGHIGRPVNSWCAHQCHVTEDVSLSGFAPDGQCDNIAAENAEQLTGARGGAEAHQLTRDIWHSICTEFTLQLQNWSNVCVEHMFHAHSRTAYHTHIESWMHSDMTERTEMLFTFYF